VVEVATNSDHAALILRLTVCGTRSLGKKAFRYEAKWAIDEGYSNVIQ
jgi:hypothetical protein